MLIYRSLDEIPADFGPTVATIGNFDGVHRGHQMVIDEVIHRAHDLSARSLAYVEKLKPKRAFFTHISHDLDHEATEAELPPNVRLAYDGLKLIFEIAPKETV